jgi:hypothetical protein
MEKWYILAYPINLELLKSEDNIKKSYTCSIQLEELFNNPFEFDFKKVKEFYLKNI